MFNLFRQHVLLPTELRHLHFEQLNMLMQLFQQFYVLHSLCPSIWFRFNFPQLLFRLIFWSLSICQSLLKFNNFILLAMYQLFGLSLF